MATDKKAGFGSYLLALLMVVGLAYWGLHKMAADFNAANDLAEAQRKAGTFKPMGKAESQSDVQLRNAVEASLQREALGEKR